jgi:type III pantothenate kinase
MHLIFDIGNSNMVVSWVKDDSWGPIIRVETKRARPEVYYRNMLSDMMLEHDLKVHQISTIVVSCVVSEVLNSITAAIRHYFGKQPIVLNGDLFAELDLHVPKPYEIGADLVANAYAIYKANGHDYIIVDFGTALTFTVLSMDNGIEGVTIAPGIKTAINALSRGTSKLPEVPLQLPETIVGKDTIHAIQSGVLYGYIGLVKEVLSRMKKELKANYRVVATGGLREVISELKGEFDAYDELLTIKGIYLIGKYAEETLKKT